MSKKKKKAMKKMVKKVIRRETSELFAAIEDEYSALTSILASINKSVQKNSEVHDLPMAVAEFSPVKDKELVKMIKKIIKKEVKNELRRKFKNYEKSTDKEICRWLNHWYEKMMKKCISENHDYINQQLENAGIELPEEESSETKDCENCSFAPICKVTMKPVSEATGAERDFLKNILGMVGYSKEELDEIFSNEENKDDDPDMTDEEDLSDEEVPNDDGEDNLVEEPHDHANKKWTNDAIFELIKIYDAEGAAAAAEHFGITEGTANRYYKKWKAEYDDGLD